MIHFQSYRTCTLGEVDAAAIGKRLALCGFVERRRDHGDVTFLDLRDRYGLVQCVVAPDVSPEAVEAAKHVKKEWIVRVEGVVAHRGEGNVNDKLKSGAVELKVEALRVLSEADATPLFVADEVNADEATRLKYRYLDLRRRPMMRNLEMRHRVAKIMRDFFDEHGFLEIETPMLCKSTPEGARDFLVPSRMNPGQFYALPQSPQLFKQILQVAGCDRYVQIARCFRDEDLRGDRQPEFTQVDVEVSFATSEDIRTLVEHCFARVLKQAFGCEVSLPLRRMTYAEGMETYGSDKPDLRFAMPIRDVSAHLSGSGFGVVSGCLEAGGRIRGIAVPRAYSRKEHAELEELLKPFGAKGILPLRCENGEWKSPLAKFHPPETLAKILETLGGAPGDTGLLVAGPDKVTSPALGRLRLHCGHSLGLVKPGHHELFWIVDPPLVEWNEDEKRFDPVHHPFTAPCADQVALLDTDLGAVKADAYDLVLDGSEIAGGSVRIHDRAMQRKVFESIGLDPAAIESKFGFLLEAFRYGVPPHAGIAFGLERVLMVMLGLDSIRDVMAFPKTTSGGCLMTEAPSPVDAKLLRELGVAVQLD